MPEFCCLVAPFLTSFFSLALEDQVKTVVLGTYQHRLMNHPELALVCHRAPQAPCASVAKAPFLRCLYWESHSFLHSMHGLLLNLVTNCSMGLRHLLLSSRYRSTLDSCRTFPIPNIPRYQSKYPCCTAE